MILRCSLSECPRDYMVLPSRESNYICVRIEIVIVSWAWSFIGLF